MRTAISATLAWAALTATLAPLPAAAVNVGVSVQISQPGVYGRIDVGRFPQPQVVLAQPVIIHRPAVPVMAAPAPVYMWVPPGHRKNWRKHCAAYGACGVPVYFVRHDWYDSHVRPPRQPRRDMDRGRHGGYRDAAHRGPAYQAHGHERGRSAPGRGGRDGRDGRGDRGDRDGRR